MTAIPLRVQARADSLLRQAVVRGIRHMVSIIGIVIVLGAILAGFLMEKGPLAVLVQPSEFIIIGGRSAGNAGRGESDTCVEEYCEQSGPRSWRIEVQQAALP